MKVAVFFLWLCFQVIVLHLVDDFFILLIKKYMSRAIQYYNVIINVYLVLPLVPGTELLKLIIL